MEKIIEKPIFTEKIVEKVVNIVVEKPTIVEKIIERPVEIVKLVEVEKYIDRVKTEIVEKIIEKPVYCDRIVEVEKIVDRVVHQETIHEVERLKEIVVYRDRVQEVERIIEKPIMQERIVVVEKIKEVIKEVGQIIQEEDKDCLSQRRFIEIWNRMFNLKGIQTEKCLTEEQFIGLISRSLMANADDLTNGALHITMGSSYG